MAKRGRPALQLSVSERLERRRAQLARSQRKSRARRRCGSPSSLPLSPPQCVSPHETSPSSKEDSTSSIAASAASTWQQPGVESSAMDAQPLEPHRDNFSLAEAVLDNSPASPNLSILERSEAHPFSRVLEAAEYEHHTSLELDTVDPLVFLLNSDDGGYPLATEEAPGCSTRPASDSLFPAMPPSSFCIPVSACTSVEEDTIVPWSVPEANLREPLLEPMPVLDPSLTINQGEHDYFGPEHSYQTTQESPTSNLISDYWAALAPIPTSHSLAIDAGLSFRQEWDTILQPTAYPLTIRRGLDDCRPVRFILAFAV